MMVFFGKIKNWDEQKEELTFKTAFVDLDSLDELDNTYADDSLHRIQIKRVRPPVDEKRISYELQKKWFVMLKRILDHYKIVPTRGHKKSLDRELRKEYLPCTRFWIGEREIISVPSVSYIKSETPEEGGLSFADLRSAIDNIIDDYTRLGVNFNVD